MAAPPRERHRPTELTGDGLFALARAGRRLPHPVLAPVMFFVLLVIGSLPLIWLAGPLEALATQSRDPAARGLAFAAGVAASAPGTVAALWLWLRFYERRPLWTVGLRPLGAAHHFLRGAAAGAAMFGVVVAAMALLGFAAPSADRPAPAGLALPSLPALLAGSLVALVGWIGQASGEEVLARGWLMPVVGARTRPWVGVLLSSAVFGALHALNPSASAVSIANTVGVGVLFALYAVWERGLWGVCGLHAAWNWAQGNVFGLQVSGRTSGAATLLDLEETGPDLLTGGAYGPEAGLLTTGVNALVIALLAVALWRRARAANAASPSRR